MQYLKNKLAIGAAILPILVLSFASHANDYGMVNVAHTVHSKANHLHRQLDRELRGHGHHARSTIRAMHKLANKAAHFHRQAESYYKNPHHLRHDYKKLTRAFRRAQNKFHHLDHHLSRHFQRDFHALENAIHRLGYYFSRGGHGGWYGHENTEEELALEFEELEFAEQ